eukprot:scaffold14198_cov107-Cylindrotheca_fusiformis.AAC.1
MQDSSAALSGSSGRSTNEENRRSGRERTSTLTWIDGHAVLRQNNYVVRGGEYIMGEDGQDGPPVKRKATTAVTTPGLSAASTTAPTKRPKVTPPHETLRIQHNERVRNNFKPKEHWRWKFLANQIPLLGHFCDPVVLQHLQQYSTSTPSTSSSSSSSSYTPLKIDTAPQGIQATLRDYQMQGLEFMVNMHKQNLSMILGDEMGL